MKLKYILLFALFIHTIICSYGQNIIIFNQSQQQNILVNENYTRMTRNENTRSLLRSLSAELPRAYEYTEFTISFSYEMRLLQTIGFNYNFLLKGKDIQIMGDFNINGFKLNPWMNPDIYTFDVQLIMPNGVVRSQTHYTNIQPDNAGVLVNVNFSDSIFLAGSSVRLMNLMVGHSQQALQNFNNQLQLIKSYKLINPGYHIYRLKQQEWNNIDSFDACQSTYNQATIAHREASELQINRLGSDPENKIQQISELRYLLDAYQVPLNQLRTQAPSLYYAKGINYIKNANWAAAERAFNKSYGNDFNNYIPAAFQWAKVKYNINQQDSSVERLYKIMARIPDSLKSELGTLAQNLYNFYSQSSAKAATQKLFQIALSHADQSENICYTFKLIDCQTSTTLSKKIAVDGLYSQLISEGNAALTASNLVLAEQKVQNAKKLETSYKKELTPSNAAGTLMLKIKQAQYDKLIAQGKNDASADRLDQALEAYKSAQNIQGDYKVKTNPSLPSLIKTTGKSIYLKKLNLLKWQLPSMKSGEAKMQYNQITRDIIQLDLGNDADIKKLTNELNQKLGSKECEEASAMMTTNVNTAKEMEVKKDFTTAKWYYDRALDVVKPMTHCGIDTAIISEQRSKIIPCVSYEALLKEAETEVVKKNYKRTNELLDQAITFHKTNKLDQFNIPLLNKENWAIDKSNDAFFIYQMADSHYKMKDYQASLRLIKAAIDKGMKYKLTKDLQTLVGASLAKIDHREKTNSPKVWVLSYMSDQDKQLKYFKSAYLKEWKVLEKNK